MATFSDLFDWLNQGAQGDIPGTAPKSQGGGDQSMVPQPQNISDVQPATGKKPGPSTVTVTPGNIGRLPLTPEDYAGGIPPTLLPQYHALVQSGLPPMVAATILTQPSQGEGETPLFHQWPHPYAGEGQEEQAHMSQPPRDAALNQHMWDERATQQQNLPTYEEHTPGDDDNLGFSRLPSGQYVPWSQPNPAAQSDEMDRMMQAWGLGSPATSAPATNDLDIFKLLGIQ